MPSNHLILCQPLLLPPSIFPSFRIFSSESVLHIRWPKCWSFSFSISLSNKYSGLISYRIYRLDLLAVQGTLKSVLQHHSSKASILRCSAFFIVQLLHPYMTTGKTIALTRRIFVLNDKLNSSVGPPSRNVFFALKVWTEWSLRPQIIHKRYKALKLCLGLEYCWPSDSKNRMLWMALSRFIWMPGQCLNARVATKATFKSPHSQTRLSNPPACSWRAMYPHCIHHTRYDPLPPCQSCQWGCELHYYLTQCYLAPLFNP